MPRVTKVNPCCTYGNGQLFWNPPQSLLFHGLSIASVLMTVTGHRHRCNVKTMMDRKFAKKSSLWRAPVTHAKIDIWNCVSFWLHGFYGYWEGLDSVNRFHHTSWVAIFTPTDRPKSIRNRCVIEVFGGVCVFSRCFLCFLWVLGFCNWTESDLFLFFS